MACRRGRAGVRGSSWVMEMTLANRRAVTRAQALKYRSASRVEKGQILDALCAVTGFNRDYARRALRKAVGPRPVRRTVR